MSSEEDYGNGDKEPVQSRPKLRMSGACDLCRQKKIRCDSAARQGSKCSNCEKGNSDCTHLHVSQKIGQGYRNVLSSSSDSLSLPELRYIMDPLLKSVLMPTYQAPTNPAIVRETLVSLARYARALESAVHYSELEPPSKSNTGSPESYTTSPRSGSEDKEVSTLSETMKRSLMLTGSGERFFGPSSSINLLQSTIEVSDCEKHGHPHPLPSNALKLLRPVFWSVHPWEQPPPSDTIGFEFPEPDLLNDLIELYFFNHDVFSPLLHRPSFERNVKVGLHLTDPGFANILLAVCSVASRYSDDERVLLEGTGSTHSSGFKWYRQIKHFHISSLRTPSLHDLQALALSVSYLKGSSTPEKCWYIIGLGIRAAQDVGLNQKVKEGTPPTIEGELRKRVFWNLLMAESAISTISGRTPSISASDFDVEFPVECDDEYWENPDPKLAFKQPPGKPSKVAFFNCLLVLIQIHCSAQQFFYSVKRPMPPPGVSAEEYDRSKLAEIDSALNAWVDSVPEHLRWGGHHSNPIFYDQSAMLFSSYYYLQILVHRPFVASPDKPSVAFSSLAICTNAARACIRIMETQSKKGFIPSPQIEIALWVSGLMLLLNLFRQRRTGLGLVDEAKEMKSVHSAINVLKMYESRDLLMALASIGGLALEPTFTKAVKRRRDDQDDQHQKQQNAKRRSPPEHPRRASTASSVTYPPISPTLSTTSHSSPSQGSNSPRSEHGAGSAYQLPFYSSDLSKPFFDFNANMNAENAALQKQLDELEAMMGGGNRFAAAPGASPTSSANVFPMQQMYQQLARQSMVSTGSAAAPVSSPTSVSAGFTPSPTAAPPPMEASSLYNPVTNNVLDVQAAAMWTGLPLGTEWADWSTYISNMEGISTSQDFSSGTTTPIPSFIGAGQPQAVLQDGGARYQW